MYDNLACLNPLVFLAYYLNVCNEYLNVATYKMSLLLQILKTLLKILIYGTVVLRYHAQKP